jgi:hypothetical protein
MESAQKTVFATCHFWVDGRKVKVLGRKRRLEGKTCGGVEKGAKSMK